jgi:hypothetical protein
VIFALNTHYLVYAFLGEIHVTVVYNFTKTVVSRLILYKDFPKKAIIYLYRLTSLENWYHCNSKQGE